MDYSADSDSKQVDVDLAPHLQFPTKKLGHLRVIVEPTKRAYQDGPAPYRGKYDYDSSHERVAVWVQATKHSMDAVLSNYSKTKPQLFWVC